MMFMATVRPMIPAKAVVVIEYKIRVGQMRFCLREFLRLAMPAVIEVKTRGIKIILSKLMNILPNRSNPERMAEELCGGRRELWPKMIPKAIPRKAPKKICAH